MSDRNDYISKIAKKIKNYRKEELPYQLDEVHVERWVQQFEPCEQLIILQETNCLLSQCYFKKKDVKEFLRSMITSKRIWGTEDIADELNVTQFLNIQRKGSSQKILLDLLNDIALETYGETISMEESDEAKRYIYLDDCLFSGNTLRRDLEQWVIDANDGSHLDIVFLAVYSAGQYYIANKVLNRLCEQKGITYQIWCLKEYKNFPNDWYFYDGIWPKETDNEHISSFIERLNEQAEENGWPIRLFREKEYQSPLFTSNESRETFEQAMLKAGAYIYSCSDNPSKSMKPLGYDFFNSLGFGAFFATYNNISNNSPLAFWWGDPNAHDGHPFKKWYPLLPRKVNESGSELISWE